MSDNTKIQELAMAFGAVPTQDSSFTEVFNAYSLALIGFIVDYLVTSGGELTDANVALQLQKLSALNVAHADHVLRTTDFDALKKTLATSDGE